MLSPGTMSASNRWQVADARFPVNGSSRQRLGFALKYAALAPTHSDWQHWEILLEETYLDLLIREDPEADAEGDTFREAVIHCGAALQYLKVALKHFGCLGRTELFPDLDRRTLAARLHFGSGGTNNLRERSLFEAITASRGRLEVLNNRPVSEATLAALCRVVASGRAGVELTQSETIRHRVLEFTLANEPTRMIGTPAYTFGVVKTKTDDEYGWLLAGQTLALAILHAQAWGLAWEFFHQVPARETREALRTGIGHKGFAQAILRFGPLAGGDMVRLVPSSTSTATFG